ncbi:Hypoxia-responsive family protein [Quillaja saponaria]|uniref:Hypoxia-responsive family protein n=1 Tax=Quillaja saponaria TaxID=32244 RepID=A0AAD7VF72_QUISA|nr:Hypoxia-responsive family protein [Quillaja saponaria]
MAESMTKFEAMREWVVEHKLRTVGCLWASGIAGSIAYEWSRPNKFSVKVIHARMNAQALTLAALAGAALVEYYDHKAKQTAGEYAKQPNIPIDVVRNTAAMRNDFNSHKN